MQEEVVDTPEFTDEQLRAALKRVGKDALQEAFAAGLSVLVLKDKSLVALHPDGTEEVVETFSCLGPKVEGLDQC